MDDALHTTEPSFLIDEHRLEQLCISVATQNNGLARKLRQTERLSPSELMDLYYAQKGRCALTGVPLEYHDSMKHCKRMQLDHIIEKRAREAEKRVIAGESGYQFGKAACITNVQWVCRFANMVKEYVRSSGLEYASLISAMSNQCKDGFPIRRNATFLGHAGRRAFRENVIRDAIEKDASVSPRHVVELLLGTIGEAEYQVVLRNMKELGWKTRRDSSYFELQKEAISAVIASHGNIWLKQSDFVDAVNAKFAAIRLPVIKSKAHIIDLAARCEIFIHTQTTKKHGRRACPGDGSALLSLLRQEGQKGMSRAACVDWLKSRNVAESTCADFIDQMMTIGCIYKSPDGENLVASLTRKEAAEKIGVSKNRLKKWGTMDWAGGVSGPAYYKASPKGQTYYRHEDIEDFMSEREPHHLDLSQCGQRIACVEGGKLGGRPTSQLSQNATA